MLGCLGAWVLGLGVRRTVNACTEIATRCGHAVRTVARRSRTSASASEPAISVDTKKKELVGPYKNGGRELRATSDPEDVNSLVITADGGWQPRLSRAVVEARTAGTGRRARFPDDCLSLAARHEQVEHDRNRLFSFITQNWRDKPRITHQVIVNLIAATTTKTGLVVRSRIDDRPYPKGRRVSDAQLALVHLEPHAFHDEWNYTIHPTGTPCV